MSWEVAAMYPGQCLQNLRPSRERQVNPTAEMKTLGRLGEALEGFCSHGLINTGCGKQRGKEALLIRPEIECPMPTLLYVRVSFLTITAKL